MIAEKYSPKDPSGYIYYLKIKFKNHTYYKIGFTKNKSLKGRFSHNGSEDYKLITHVFLFKYIHDAYHVEQRLHSFLKQQRSLDGNFKEGAFYKNGQSELYSYDVLEMDDSITQFERIKAEQRRKNWENAFEDEQAVDDISPAQKAIEILFGESFLFNKGIKGFFIDVLFFIPLLALLIPAIVIIYYLNFEKHRNNNIMAKHIYRIDPNYHKNRTYFLAVVSDLKEYPRISDSISKLDMESCFRPSENSCWWQILAKWADENDISNDDLPRNKESMENLERLNLSNYQELDEVRKICNIPKEIGNLSNLKCLEIISCSIYTLPSDIYKLTNLTSLTIAETEIKALPVGISSLQQLVKLDLSSNNIEDIPDEIGTLINLEELHLGGESSTRANNFYKLPGSIGRLKNLKMLNILDGNFQKSYLERIPRELIFLTNLEILEVDAILDKETAKNIHELKKLKKIFCKIDDIQSLKILRKKLPNLEEGDVWIGEPYSNYYSLVNDQ